MKSIAVWAASGFLFATSASAAVMTVTGTGTISYGYDTTDYLGLGTELAGKAAKITFVYDTENLPNLYVYDGAYYSAGVSSGSSQGEGRLPFFLQSYFEIEGIRQDVIGTYNNYIGVTHSPSYAHGTHVYQIQSHDYAYGPPEINNAISINTGLPGEVRTFSETFSLGAEYGMSGNISFGLYPENDYNAPAHSVNAWLALSSLTVSSDIPAPSPVPLPAGAPLALLGLAALFGLRRVRPRRS